MKILDLDFYSRDTVQVAQDLLGKILVFGPHKGIITETEAYVGQGDPACHAAKGLTPRTKPMFGPVGHAYVYFIYGMYYCLNIVTEAEGFPAAVLIRGLWIPDAALHLNGPGKLCRHLGITTAHNEWDLTRHDFHVLDSNRSPLYQATPRIGITKGQDKLWRYVVYSDELLGWAGKTMAHNP